MLTPWGGGSHAHTWYMGFHADPHVRQLFTSAPPIPLPCAVEALNRWHGLNCKYLLKEIMNAGEFILPSWAFIFHLFPWLLYQSIITPKTSLPAHKFPLSFLPIFITDGSFSPHLSVLPRPPGLWAETTALLLTGSATL